MTGPGRRYRSAVWTVGVLLVGTTLTVLLGACGRQSPTGVERTASLRIQTVLPSGGSAGPASASTPGAALVPASVDSMTALTLTIYEQTTEGEILRFSKTHYPRSVEVPDSMLVWEATVPWAFRYRIEVQAVGTRYFGGDYGGTTDAGLQYLGDVTVDATPSLPEQVTVDLLDIVPQPWIAWPAEATPVAMWGAVPGAVGYAIHGRLYGMEMPKDTTDTGTSLNIYGWTIAQVAASLPHGRTSALSYPVEIGYAARLGSNR
jgi:hypothetical protein